MLTDSGINNELEKFNKTRKLPNKEFIELKCRLVKLSAAILLRTSHISEGNIVNKL
jgi:hypothetical protein